MCALHLALGQSEVDDSIPETGGILLPGGSIVIKLLEGEDSQGTCQYCLLFLLQLHLGALCIVFAFLFSK